MKSSKKLIIRIAQIFFSLSMISLVACSGNGASPSSARRNGKAPPSQQMYRTYLRGVETLDPALVQDTASLQAVDMVFTGLVSLDDSYTVHQQMADMPKPPPDGITWTFHLKSNLKFSDGTPLTSQDVAYSIDRALQPSTHSPDCFTFLGVIKDANLLHEGKIQTLIGDSILKPDIHTLTIITATINSSYFLRALSEPCSFAVEKKLVLKYGIHFSEHLNEGGGDGPFVVSDYKPTHGIDFKPNHYYYGPQPQLQEVSFDFYQDTYNAFQGYQLGLVDGAPVPLADYDNVTISSPEFHQISQPISYYYMMNYLAKPFDNIHIRQAFALALNREDIANKILNGSLAKPTYNLIPQSLGGYHSLLDLTGPAGVTDFAGDPGLAQKLLMEGLHEEGWTSVAQMPPITLTYSTTDPLLNVPDSKICTPICMWKKVLGVTVTPNLISDDAAFFNMIDNTRNSPNGLQFWAESWAALYADPRIFTTQVFGRDETNNTVNYGQNSSTDVEEQQSVQKELEDADSLDDTTRYQRYQQAEQQLVDDVAWMPVFQWNSTFLLKPYVRSLGSNCATPYTILSLSYPIPPDDWACIYIAAH